MEIIEHHMEIMKLISFCVNECVLIIPTEENIASLTSCAGKTGYPCTEE